MTKLTQKPKSVRFCLYNSVFNKMTKRPRMQDFVYVIQDLMTKITQKSKHVGYCLYTSGIYDLDD